MQGRVIRQSGLYLFLLACLRDFWLQPGKLGSAMLFENQERGKEAYWGEKTWVVSTVVASKGLLNTSGRRLGFFISTCNSLYQREEPPRVFLSFPC